MLLSRDHLSSAVVFESAGQDVYVSLKLMRWLLLASSFLSVYYSLNGQLVTTDGYLSFGTYYPYAFKLHAFVYVHDEEDRPRVTKQALRRCDGSASAPVVHMPGQVRSVFDGCRCELEKC